MTDEERLRADLDKVCAGIREAFSTGRLPEDVQLERHAREREARHREYLARLSRSQRFRRWVWLNQEALWLLGALVAIVAGLLVWGLS